MARSGSTPVLFCERFDEKSIRNSPNTNMLGIAPYVQLVLQGTVIVAILWLDCFGIKRKKDAV